MNERILELAKQAGLKFPSETAMSPVELEFAQLIVQECIEIVDKWSYDGPYREEGDIIPVKKIKEHFGVEE